MISLPSERPKWLSQRPLAEALPTLEFTPRALLGVEFRYTTAILQVLSLTVCESIHERR